MFKAVLVASVVSVCTLATTAASAQVIYEPVRYQHALGNDDVLYYGGSNPRVIENARRTHRLYNQPRAYDGHGHELTTIRKGLTGRAPYVYSDVAPYTNLSLYGFTALDARNEAYGGVPTYFRKGDLLRAGYYAADGSYIVPAGARPVSEPVVRRVVRPTTTTQPARPRAIIIIPKRPATPRGEASDKLVTMAK